MRRILFQETDFATLPNPPAGFKYIGFDGPNFTEKDNTGVTTPAGGGGGGYVDITYSEIIYAIDESELKPGSYYRITDFRTCYDVPEYYINGNRKTIGAVDYVQGSVEPIIVFATSINTISSTAYQPEYPNDRIQYDCTFNSTNTGGTAYGRITERIDEYNNRTDYDHRNISFIRFQSYNQGAQLTGTIGSYNSSTGIISGNNTLFLSEVDIGDILFFYVGYMAGVKVVSMITDTEITVVVDSLFGSGINFSGGTIPFYTSTSTNNYYEYKEVYIGQKNEEDFTRVLTFNLDGSAIHNYVGDYSKFYLNEVGSNSGFLLANNVFYGNRTYSNTIGDRSYNNTGTYWFSRNTIAGRFYNNVIYNHGFYSNNIGEYFDNNIIKSSVYGNKIEQYFENNKIYSQFYDNQIGNSFYQNTIYSDFYENQIGVYFEYNQIGDNGNLGNFEFYRNRIGNNFEYNTIRMTFRNNQIGNQFNYNKTNGSFYQNVIGNGFNHNQNIGHDFYGNHIGNGFNGNDNIGDYFQNNKIGEYFEYNYIYKNFKDNSIGNDFGNNTLGDIQYFNWANTNIENLTARNYNSFYNALDENIDNVILGKELIMHFTRNSGTVINSGQLIIGETYEITNYLGTDDFTDIANVQSGNINTNGCIFVATGYTVSNWSSQSELTELTSYDEYHEVKFTQWTRNNNGGGFSYERTKVYPTGGPTVYFTKINYQTKVDVIIEGRLEITRGNNQAIYNAAIDEGWSNNTPYGTQWNSIYTQTGFSFENNDIQNGFKGNYILDGFGDNSIGYGFAYNELYGQFGSNITSTYIFDNNFYGSAYSNEVGDNFYSNNIGDEFNSNKVGANFYSNNIAYGFSNNQIGKDFYNNEIEEGFGFGGGDSRNNIIGDYFQNNTIGEYFYNNKVASYFENNTVGYYFQRNNIDTQIYGEDFTVNYGNILALTYTSSGTTSTDNYYTVSGNTNEHGTGSTFGVTVSGGTISSFSLINAGNQYEVGDTITIPGNIIGGQIGVISSFDASNGLGKNGIDSSYFDVTVTGGSGSNARFNIDVISGTISNISLSNGGGSYLIGNTLSVSGSQFGGTNSVDDFIITVNSLYSDNINITVTAVSATPSVYESYNCQIFERKGNNRRLSFYDENDILTIKNIKE